MAHEERDILNRWINGNRKFALLFRNQVGGAWAGRVLKKITALGTKVTFNAEPNKKYVILEEPRWMEFGLMKGSGDFVGWRTKIVTPDMVGQKVAIFTSVEGKTKDGTLSDDQRLWKMRLTADGGIAMVVRDPKDKAIDWEPQT
jgi:hypothetical protein